MAEHRQHFRIVAYDDLASIRNYIESSALTLGANLEMAGDIVMAANEAVTNIFEHGFAESECQIELVVAYEDARLTVAIIDNGPYFDPTQFDLPDLNLPFIERTPGGMGIYMMSKFTDHIYYDRTLEGKNRLILEIGETDGD